MQTKAPLKGAFEWRTQKAYSQGVFVAFLN
jgi:hypothetical protein